MSLSCPTVLSIPWPYLIYHLCLTHPVPAVTSSLLSPNIPSRFHFRVSVLLVSFTSDAFYGGSPWDWTFASWCNCSSLASTETFPDSPWYSSGIPLNPRAFMSTWHYLVHSVTCVCSPPAKTWTLRKQLFGLFCSQLHLQDFQDSAYNKSEAQSMIGWINKRDWILPKYLSKKFRLYDFT